MTAGRTKVETMELAELSTTEASAAEAVKSRRARPRAFAVLALCLLAIMLALPAGAAASVPGQVASVLAKRGLAGSGTSVGVYDLTREQLLYALRWNTLRLPASNEKLVTSATALADWSATHRFGTQILLQTAAPDADGVLTGDVYLKGLGDPSLQTADLRAIAARIQALGVTKITGSVVGDDSYFDSQRSVSSWRPGMTAFCGPLSALTLNEGFGPHGRYVSDPALWAARKLTTILRRGGVKVVHAAVHGVTPATATLLHNDSSAPLSRILATMNKRSDDFYAEELFKGLGASFGGAGTTAAGEAVADQFLAGVGLTNGYRILDGSGLSYRDKLSAHTIIDLLGIMSRRPDFATYWKSLSVAGVDGTLTHRMRGTAAAGNVHAKTGTLAAASCLSGYVTARNGDMLVFSILMNGGGLSQYSAHAAQDAIAEALARSSP